jgi:enoyl-CoA hydratase/carnithine racemase
MDTHTHVRVERASGLLTITLARPEKMNALTGSMYRALIAALQLASAEQSVHAVLLAAEGDHFCAGNDVDDFLALGSSRERFEDSEAFRFLCALAVFDKPLIAAVRGRAIGIGCTLLLHCDLVSVAEDVRLSTPFVDLALVPEAGSTLLLPARIGHLKAFAMFTLGETLDGRAAVEGGVANAALAAGEVFARARAAALQVAGKPSGAVQATKKLMREHRKLLDVIAAESRVFAELLMSEDAQAIFRSFMARRASKG